MFSTANTSSAASWRTTSIAGSSKACAAAWYSVMLPTTCPSRSSGAAHIEPMPSARARSRFGRAAGSCR
jgi:hypothetical protein